MTLVNYTSIEIKESNEPAADLSKFDFILDPIYYEQKLSDNPKMFLRETVIKKLLNVQKYLGKYRLKIWDTYRPRDVQNNIYQKFWNELKSQHPDWNEDKLKSVVGTFVSPPFQKDRIPPHSTGGTVDLTLTSEKGIELNMGTNFDHFGPESSPYYFEIFRDKPEIANNRKILREAMFKEGFTVDSVEWWHFDYGNQVWALKTGNPFAFYGEISNFL